MFQRLYNKLDSKMLGSHLDIQKYRNLSEITKEDGKKLIENGAFNDKSLEYLALNQNNKDFNNYFSVMHQFTLIALDILGYNPENESSRKIAAEVGRNFLLLKAMDLYVEQAENKFEGLRNILFLKNYIKLPSGSSENYIFREYHELSDKKKKIVDKLLAPAMVFYNSKDGRKNSGKDKARIEAKKKIGVISGELQNFIITKNLNEEFSDNQTLFLVDAGITGAMLDDFKDFKLDQEKGFGYSSILTKAKLVDEARTYLNLTLKNLPSEIQKEKFRDFVRLSFLYNMREKLGLDEKE